MPVEIRELIIQAKLKEEKEDKEKEKKEDQECAGDIDEKAIKQSIKNDIKDLLNDQLFR